MSRFFKFGKLHVTKGNGDKLLDILLTASKKLKWDICQLVWLTKNTSYENVGGIFLRKNTIDS